MVLGPSPFHPYTATDFSKLSPLGNGKKSIICILSKRCPGGLWEMALNYNIYSEKECFPSYSGPNENFIHLNKLQKTLIKDQIGLKALGK